VQYPINLRAKEIRINSGEINGKKRPNAFLV
jgi:hypothetical protein